MKSVDIINVAGLLMDGKNDGIERELKEEVKPRFLKTIAPTPTSSALEHPKSAIERAVSMIRETIQEIEQQFGMSKVLLIGRSHGAFIALLSAINMEFRKILKAILIEGPLHPDIPVTPPPLLFPLMGCGIHYKTRPTLAREAVESLEKLGTSRVIIVQGGAEDQVVPTEAQIIPGDFRTIESSDICAGTRGLIVKLPPHVGGRSSGMKRILPRGYRNHLFWSEEKMRIIRRIIENAADSI